MTTDTGHVFFSGPDGGGWTYLGTTEGMDFTATPAVPGAWEPVIIPATTTATFTFAGAAYATALRAFHLLHGGDPQRPAWRCPWCNPPGNPRPLCINGHEYSRRRKSRRRAQRRRGR